MRSVYIVSVLLFFLCLSVFPSYAEGHPEQVDVPVDTSDTADTQDTTDRQETSDIPEVSPETPATLRIDNSHIYEGMDRSYSDGYLPRITDRYAIIVVPLLCDGELEGNSLTASIDIGGSSDVPFICRNYEKTVKATDSCIYVVYFAIELKEDHRGGSYPITVKVWGTDVNKNKIEKNITVYTVIDTLKPEETGEDDIPFTPKLLISSHRCISPKSGKELNTVYAGDKVKIIITLKNTSKKEAVSNMTVTASAESRDFILESDSESQYIESLSADSEIEITYEYKISDDIPDGQYAVNLSYDFVYRDGAVSSGSGKVMIPVNGKGEEKTVLTPKVLVESYEYCPLPDGEPADGITAGENFEIRITLINTSKTEYLHNMTVTAASESSSLVLNDRSNCRYIDKVEPGGRIDVVYEYQAQSDMGEGRYDVNISYDFNYGEGMSAGGSGKASVSVVQPLELELSLHRIPSKATVSDTVTIGVEAINISRAKAYNLRAVLEADGFSPVGNAFIGDLDGGAMGSSSFEVNITGLTEGNFPYGQTDGTVTFFYEDIHGNLFEEVKTFSAVIETPFSENISQSEDDPLYWWIIVAVIFTFILGFTIFAVTLAVKRKIKDEYRR